MLCLILEVSLKLAAADISGGELRASPSHFQSTGWRLEQGLPANKAMSVAQTPDGYLWIGTYEGLARFDGIRFKRFDNTNVPGWQDGAVTALYVAHNGVLWIGHVDGAVSAYKNGRFESFAAPSDWNANRIMNLAEDKAAELWAQDDLGQLFRIRDHLRLAPEKGSANSVSSMITGPDGNVWVVRCGRLSRLDGERVTAVDLPSEMPTYIHGICGSADGGIWILAEDELWRFQGSTWKHFPGTLQFGGTPVQAMIETTAGQIVGGTTDHGMVLIDPKNRLNDLIFSRSSGFDSDWVLSLCEDKEGDLWLATGTSGLVRLSQKKVVMLEPSDSWQGRAVLSVSATHYGGYWVGTEGAGVYRLQEGNWINYAKPAGIRTPYIWSMAEDIEGRFWLGTWGGGVYLENNGMFSRPAGLDSITAPVTALLRARQGGIWLGMANGVARYDGEKIVELNLPGNLPIRNVRSLLEDPDGSLWIGTRGEGLYCIHDGNVRKFSRADGLSSDFIQCLRRDGSGALWIGTRGSGLNRLERNHISIVDSSKGLPDDSICDIEDDGLGYFWISSRNGIFRVDQHDLARSAEGTIHAVPFVSYGLSEGLSTLSASGGLQPAGCIARDGSIVFAMDRGLAKIDPRQVHANTHVPPVEIESIKADDHEVKESAGHPGHFEIEPGRTRIEIDYTALSFAAPEKVQFKRRLEGLDKEWVPVGTERIARYSYLPPGRYIFKVLASNNDGVWNNIGRSVMITILPYFWQTASFEAAAILGVVALVGAGVWLETRRRLKKRLDQLERAHAIQTERSRIASDMHDDLGAHLTRITMLSETARADMDDPMRVKAGLTMIYETAGEVTKAMDEIVWAVNPKHDTLPSLGYYLEKFALDLLRGANFRCRLNFPADYPDWCPSSEVRHNLFLAYKEALNNAVRHSAAKTVTVSLELRAAGCALKVADENAEGEIAEEKRTRITRISAGNGIANMKRRMARVGGSCEVEITTSGCTVTLFIPVNAPGCTGTIASSSAVS